MTSWWPHITICLIVVGTLAIIQLLSNFIRLLLGGEYTNLTLTQLVEQHSIHYGWALKLGLNCFGYSCVFIPTLLVYKYTKTIKYIERFDRGIIPTTIRCCLHGSRTDGADLAGIIPLTNTTSTASNAPKKKRTFVRECVLLCYCFFGLMASYLVWGVLQEKIMTQEYVRKEGDKEIKSHFKDSQFLVFANRFLAFCVAGWILLIKRSPRHRAPLFKYSYASFSNILSAWFQYEALKFVNFPTQVLAKSCKIIPVIIMGKIIFKTKYEFYEYTTALMISMGMVFFMLGSTEEGKVSSVTTLTGIFLLCMYMVFDSFTSNWQGDLFKTYGMTSIQMMCGVNMFSTLFTASSLFVQSGFLLSLDFAMKHPSFVYDCTILSISSAVGQLFIFYTISEFGPVVFTIIMTLRQAIAILLSCLIYGHQISFLGVFGIAFVFFAVFLRVYCNQRLKALRHTRTSNLDAKISKEQTVPILQSSLKDTLDK